jgi:hypothetical protein
LLEGEIEKKNIQLKKDKNINWVNLPAHNPDYEIRIIS